MHGTAEEKHPRGVFKTPYKVRGGVYALVAIDSTGEVVKFRRLTPDVNEDRAAAWLRECLDRMDPVPQLVRERRTLPAPPHPCQRDDHLSFALRTTRRNIARLPHYDDD